MKCIVIVIFFFVINYEKIKAGGALDDRVEGMLNNVSSD